MTRSIRDGDILDTNRILSNLINDYIEGELDREPPIHRAVVLKIDQIGGQFSDEEDAPNPRNTIKARLLDGSSELEDDEDLPVFWPIFPYDIMPIKEGEHVFVMFEDVEKRSGYWVSRIPQPSVVNNVQIDNRNFVPGTKQYEADPSNDFSEINIQQAVQDLHDENLVAPELSPEFVIENPPGPMFKARAGDRVIEGSHNTIIVLGRDRPSNTEEGQTDAAGTIDIVAGRQIADDMDLENDQSRVYITRNSNVDTNFGLDQIGTNANPSAAIVVKSNEIRIVARNGMKIVCEGGDLVINANNISLGNPDGTEEPLVLGNKLSQILNNIIDTYTTHTHGVVSVGSPTSVPASPLPPLTNILSQTVKTK